MDLNPSKLGTREYWDDLYQVERKNFSENPSDTGECWFSDSGAEEKVTQFVEDQLEEGEFKQDFDIVDLGSGNGRLLFSVEEIGFTGNLLGLDYSRPAVEFAADIAKHEGFRSKFETVDMLSEDESWIAPEKWDLVLDKGTLDAIALSASNKSAIHRYREVVEKLLKPGAYFLITSCNFTEEELVALITAGSLLKVWKKVNYPSFEFGGQKGTTICTIAFQRI